MDSNKSIFWNKREGRLRGLWRLLLQALFLIGISFLVAIIIGIIISIIRERFIPVISVASEKALLFLYSVLTMTLATLLSVYLAGHFLDKRPFSAFGLTLKKGGLSDLLFGFVVGGLLLSGLFFIEYLLGWVQIKEVVALSTADSQFFINILLSLLIYILVGIEEELFARGYLLLNLSETLRGIKTFGEKGGLIIAVFLSALVFGGLHLSNPNIGLLGLINISLVGVLLALGFLYTGKLALSIGIHISWNFFQGHVFGFPVSGVNELSTSFITIEQKGHDLWTGGRFGPEGGLLGTIILLLGFLFIMIWIKLHYRSVENRLSFWKK